MELRINYCKLVYFIWDSDTYIKNDKELAKYLNIKLEDYLNLMNKYGAYEFRRNEYYFKTEEDAKSFINSPELESYIIMNKLMEE